MNLAEERPKELDGLVLEADERASVCCRLAAGLIDKGQYEAAREALAEFWRGAGERPKTEGLGRRAAAEVLLQAGALSGWVGASKPLNAVQADAKDLISESVTLFESLGEAEEVACARSELALCYWREDAYDEARVLLTRALGEIRETARRAKVLLRLTTVEFCDGRYGDALNILKENAYIFDERVSDALRGNFHNQLALVLKQLGTVEGRSDYLDRAIIEYTAAIYHQERAGHERYRATNENNLANLLRKMGRYGEAHEHLNRAGAVLVRLKDAGLLAQVDETRARVLVEEKKYAEAERVIARAVRTLEAGGAGALLSEALTTQGVAWARLGKTEASVAVLRRAVGVAEEAGALCNAALAALTLIEEHGAGRALAPEELYETYRRADRLLKDAQHAEGVERLRACARLVMRRLSGARPGESNFTLFDAVHELEARLIGRALEEGGGSVTHAAQLLGMRHQTFLAMLNTRHRKLLGKRKPAGRRLRSIIKDPPEG